ncbi:MAG: 4Fe-4S dicluster domain-containing protein [Fuerstiella sp.]|nr:4Fe-4S dicluster domain-containing protein [Fuerstiella sp.]MCP4855005.1 4Fe-4S dicluster domain-containing protein [Fuerstiella sp.]
MNVKGMAFIDTEPLLSREIFGNVSDVSKFVFYGLAFIAVASFSVGIYQRSRLWKLGVKQTGQRSNRISLRRIARDVLLQRRMLGRPQASLAHRLLFRGFLVLFIGTLLIAVEHVLADLLGREPTDPLFHKGIYYAVYEVVLDLFGLALLTGSTIFMVRRMRPGSSFARSAPDWIVLAVFLMIGLSGYLVEGLRIIHAETPMPWFSFVGCAVAESCQTLGMTSRTAGQWHVLVWWAHAIMALIFIAAFPYTRLLHSVAGALHLTTRDEIPGAMRLVSLEELEETGRVGVGSIEHFDRVQLREMDACVSCGRCEDSCPAFEAGKPLSPREVVQDLRTHLNAAGPLLLAKKSDATAGKATDGKIAVLHSEIISEETLWSCTTCGACANICPIGVSPQRMITDMRRYLIGEGKLRGAPAASLQKTQRSGNPWGLPAEERFAWAEGLKVPTVVENPEFEILYWVGCAASYDRRIQRVARSIVKLLNAADVSFAVLGSQERCTGESARRMGDEFLFQELAAANVENLNEHGVKRIVAHCPHCVNSLLHDYPQMNGRYEVVHHSQLLAQLIKEGRLEAAPEAPGGDSGKVTFHDPCYLARAVGVTEPPRQILAKGKCGGKPEQVVELSRNRQQTACCGAGGGRMWFDDAPSERSGGGRVEEIVATGADTVAVGCPFCLVMLSDGVANSNSDMKVLDVAEILAERLIDP